MRTALVTGAARGIGAAISDALTADGLRVAGCDVLEGPDIVPMDVSDTASVNAAVERIEAEYGPVEVLVNCAGWDEMHPFLDTGEEFWDRVIEINYKGCLRTTKRVLPGMVEVGWGRVVNISSDAGRVGSSMESVYAGAKGGVIAFTKTIAREVARNGVTANVVCPGPTRTAMLAGMEEKVVEGLTRAVPMKRLGEPEDVAAAVAFFASERAGFITGQTLSVSGGLTMA